MQRGYGSNLSLTPSKVSFLFSNFRSLSQNLLIVFFSVNLLFFCEDNLQNNKLTGIVAVSSFLLQHSHSKSLEIARFEPVDKETFSLSLNRNNCDYRIPTKKSFYSFSQLSNSFKRNNKKRTFAFVSSTDPFSSPDDSDLNSNKDNSDNKKGNQCEEKYENKENNMQNGKGILGESPVGNEEGEKGQQDTPILALPEAEDKDKVQTLEVGGAGIKLDDLGPVIVNKDGTMRRIANWANLSPQEQAATLRRIGKRNQERVKELQERQEKEKLKTEQNDTDGS